MNLVINKYFLSAVVVVLVIFWAAYLLRQQPIYRLTKVVIPALAAKSKASYYSESYIGTIKENYVSADCEQGDSLCKIQWMQVPPDSMFQISLQQVIYSSSIVVSSWPIVEMEQNGNLVAKFRISAKEDFEIGIHFKRKGDKYYFDSITNFSTLLKYRHEYVTIYKLEN